MLANLLVLAQGAAQLRLPVTDSLFCLSPAAKDQSSNFFARILAARVVRGLVDFDERKFGFVQSLEFTASKIGQLLFRRFYGLMGD